MRNRDLGKQGIHSGVRRRMLQEAARDSQAAMAFAGMVDVAETARQQDSHLYGEMGTRIMAAMEFQGAISTAKQREIS
jgi:hypothetical protein